MALSHTNSQGFEIINSGPGSLQRGTHVHVKSGDISGHGTELAINYQHTLPPPKSKGGQRSRKANSRLEVRLIE